MASIKLNVKWLPLDVDALDDIKIMNLVSALGMEGYGTYIMLIQYLAKQEPEYSLPMDFLKHLAYRNHVSEEKLKAVVSSFNLFEVENERFYSNSLLRRMERYDNLRDINRKKANTRWNNKYKIVEINAAALPQHTRSNAAGMHSIVQNSIVQNSIKQNNIKQNSIKENKTIKKFKNIPPSLDEIKLRIEERKIESFTAESFYAHYESNGWMVGKSKMKNWDAALSTWNNNSSGFASGTKKGNKRNEEEVDYSKPQKF
ncbi:MAG: Lin1244/Lin1753 domain-containing protein [Bacteroidales bacterium]